MEYYVVYLHIKYFHLLNLKIIDKIHDLLHKPTFLALFKIILFILSVAKNTLFPSFISCLSKFLQSSDKFFTNIQIIYPVIKKSKLIKIIFIPCNFF